MKTLSSIAVQIALSTCLCQALPEIDDLVRKIQPILDGPEWQIVKDISSITVIRRNVQFQNPINLPAVLNESELWERFSFNCDYRITILLDTKLSQEEYGKISRAQILWMCFFALLASGCSRKSHVATIKAQGGYEVRISADRFYENQRSFYCELWLNGRQLKPIHFFEASEETKYEVVEATNKIGFKIIDSPTHETLIMVNRKTGESWPWTSDTDTIQDTHARKVKLDSLFTKAEQGVAPKNR